ncbi:MAG: hypothetical protein U1F36_07655 [Planctomycetota bacterium]
MSDTLFALAHTAALCAIAFALVVPRLRAPVSLVLAALGAAALVLGVIGGPRTLEVTASFAAFRDSQFTIAEYPIETVTAAGHHFGLVALAFCLLWAFELRRLGPRGETGSRANPFFHPLILAWSGILLVLAFEKTAAPRGLVHPVAFERAIFPAAISAAALLAFRHKSAKQALIRLCIFVSAARWPLAALGTLATEREFGTSLDVHGIVDFADPFRQIPMRVVAHSSDQLAWLLWGPHLLVFPALYLLSAGGIAFAVAQFVLHPPGTDATRVRTPA